jgi:hypothetical protein
MNLFEINSRLAVKLNQQFTTLYDLEYSEYSLLFNIVKKDIEEKNESLTTTNSIQQIPQSPVKVNLPDHLKLK